MSNEQGIVQVPISFARYGIIPSSVQKAIDEYTACGDNFITHFNRRNMIVIAPDKPHGFELRTLDCTDGCNLWAYVKWYDPSMYQFEWKFEPTFAGHSAFYRRELIILNAFLRR